MKVPQYPLFLAAALSLLPACGTSSKSQSHQAAVQPSAPMSAPCPLVASTDPWSDDESDDTSAAASKKLHAPDAEDTFGSSLFNPDDPAFNLAVRGLKADLAGKLDECIVADRASVALKPRTRSMLHLASCESRSGRLVDALGHTQLALDLGIRKKDEAAVKIANARLQDLLPRVPRVTFLSSPDVVVTGLALDDRPVKVGSMTRNFSVDPGKHAVVVCATRAGAPSVARFNVDLSERQLATIVLPPPPP